MKLGGWDIGLYSTINNIYFAEGMLIYSVAMIPMWGDIPLDVGYTIVKFNSAP
jgi:hypothetical protein